MPDIKKSASELRKLGRGNDTILAHITPQEFARLDMITDGVSTNPKTGLPEFLHGGEPGSDEPGDEDDNDRGDEGGVSGGFSAADLAEANARSEAGLGSDFGRGLRNISSTFSFPTGTRAGFLKAIPVAGTLMSIVEFLQGAGFKSVQDFPKGERRGDTARRKPRPGLGGAFLFGGDAPGESLTALREDPATGERRERDRQARKRRQGLGRTILTAGLGAAPVTRASLLGQVG